MARIINKGLIGQEELALGTSTFTCSTSTGGALALHQINLTCGFLVGLTQPTGSIK